MDADLTVLNGLIEKLRPRLHRYCARMVGSAFDGEDVVQEALANAASAWSATIESPESWLFRIAHNASLDALRRRKRLSAFEADAELAAFADPAAIADARVSVETSLAALQTLTPVERASVVLSDVLGYANEEAARILSISVAAVKAAIHRGRKRLHDAPPLSETPASYSLEERDRLRAYADRFNARDFDALRDLLAEDVRLDLVNRRQLSGKKDVSVYFARYSEVRDLHVGVGLAEGIPALLFSNVADTSRTLFVVRLGWRDEKIASIRDFHYAHYVMASLTCSVF
jgi:RNA polymerase sigma-70 factor, ECF subfamily